MVAVAVVGASHFRGGLIHWKTLAPINMSSYVAVEITQRYGWRRSHSRYTYCDDNTISKKTLISGDWLDMPKYLTCRVGCRGDLGSVLIYCTDFSVVEDWMVGEKTYTLVRSHDSVRFRDRSAVLE